MCQNCEFGPIDSKSCPGSKECVCGKCKKKCDSEYKGYARQPNKPDSKHICGSAVDYVVYDECTDYKPIKEDSTMSRSARKRELKETIIPQREDAVAEANIALDEANDELVRLALDTTAKDETIRQLMKVKKMNRETAIEAIALKEKGYDI